MIRLKAYAECFNCIWFANPLKCNEYETCKDCPNSIDGNCICCEQKPENEKQCPNFKEKTMTMQELLNEIKEKDNKIALLKETIECIKFNVALTRKETAKEFAEKLKEKYHNYYPSIDHYCCSEKAVNVKDIDELLKEYENDK